MTKHMLVDGNSLAYRAFFALPSDLMTASGQVTNAVYGFTSMLANLVRDHGPDHVVVAFDRPEPTFRHERLETYKANREAAPDILYQQLGLVRRVVEVLGLPIVELPGYEADDIIATLATQARDRGDDVMVVTGDRDSYQLVEDPHVRVLYNKRGVSDYALYDEAGILERTGVSPAAYVEYAALRGDPSDNLPGVPGVGEKTAAKLITAYGGLDGIFAHVDEQTPKLRENLALHEGRVRENAEIMQLVRDAPLAAGLDDLHRNPIDVEELRALVDFLEFHSLADRIAEAFGTQRVVADAPDEVAVEVSSCSTVAAAVEALARAGDECVAWAGVWEGAPGHSPLVGLAVAAAGEGATAAFVPAALLRDSAVLEALTACAGGPDRRVCAHDAKSLIRSLDVLGVDLRGLALDTMIAAYLLDPADVSYGLEDVVARYTGLRLEAPSGPETGQLDLDGSHESEAEVAGRAAVAVAHTAAPITTALENRGLRTLNDEIEVPLVRVLARMEIVGIGVDADVLRSLHDALVAECAQLRAAIWKDAGEEFNVNSTPKLREILFERLGLTPQKKTKTGYSTDAASLEKLIGQHPIVEHLLRYREVEKLRSTYGEGLIAAVGADGRIHATFNQTVARTGRLSSDAPNLHNIPVRTQEGRAFRTAFVPSHGCRLLVADYDQIELRCIAHLAEDPGLITAFEAGEDIHSTVAARVFAVPLDAVNFEQRAKAKMVSYGLAYGMEAYGLGQRLAIPTGDAQAILDAYFAAFPAVRAYMDATVEEARERGYTETLFGRRRQIPELSSPNHRVRQAGERQAMNAGIQGLAADIFKVALVRLDHVIEAGGYAGRIVLQVHDEVLVEAPAAEVDVLADVVVATMSGAFDLRVPLEVHLDIGDSWAAAKG